MNKARLALGFDPPIALLLDHSIYKILNIRSRISFPVGRKSPPCHSAQEGKSRGINRAAVRNGWLLFCVKHMMIEPSTMPLMSNAKSADSSAL